MKKIFIAILAFLYLGTSVGATVHIHYCMGKLAEWGFGRKEAKNCDKCGMEQTVKYDNGCCKDENKYIKNNSDQKHTETAFQMAQQVAAALPVSFFEIPVAHVPSITEENPISHAPPRNSGIAVYIRNCVFRI